MHPILNIYFLLTWKTVLRERSEHRIHRIALHRIASHTNHAPLSPWHATQTNSRLTRLTASSACTSRTARENVRTRAGACASVMTLLSLQLLLNNSKFNSFQALVEFMEFEFTM